MCDNNSANTQILSDDALFEKKLLLDNVKAHFSRYNEHNYGCGYTNENEWNPFIHAPTLDTVDIYKNQHCALYNSIIDAVTGKICQYIEKYEILDWTNPHRILHPIDLPCFTLRYTGQTISAESNCVVLGEITGFVYKKYLQTSRGCFNLKLINEETPKYILDTSKAGNLMRFLKNSSLGPLFSYKKLSSNVQIHTVYIDNWPHIIVTTIPGIELTSGCQLIADYSSLQNESPKPLIHPAYNDLSLKNEINKIIPVLGIPLGASVCRIINGNNVVGKVVDFIPQNGDGLFVVNYPDGDYEFYTRSALMIHLLKEYLKDSKLEQLLVPLDKKTNLVTRDINLKDNKVKKKKSSIVKFDTVLKPVKHKHNSNKSYSSINTDHHSSNKSINKKSSSKKSLKRLSSKSSSIKEKPLPKLDDAPKQNITRTLSKDSSSSIITRLRRTFIGGRKNESIEFYASKDNNVVLNSKTNNLIDDELEALHEQLNDNIEDSSSKMPLDQPSNKKSGSNKVDEEVSFRRNTPEEVKEKIPLKMLKEYCIDTLLEMGRLRRNWRDFDNRKQFNFHFAKISSAKTVDDLEPHFTRIFYKLYQYVDLTVIGNKINFDAVSSCEKENPQLIDHLLELLTNIFSGVDS